MTLLSTSALGIEIGGKLVCDNLEFTLTPGQRWGVLGANGAGKTTLLVHLAGLMTPDWGEIMIQGTSIAHWNRKALARILGVLFQDSQDTFPTTVMDTALTGRYPYLPFWSLEGSEDYTISMNALRDVALEGMANRQVNTLSGGERRRLAIATMLIQNPLIWLLDEPTNHLDLHHQISLLDLVLTRVASVNGGLVMVLHDVNLVSRYCTHAMLILGENNIVQGTVTDVLTRENLERLYSHPVMQLQSDNRTYYFPG